MIVGLALALCRRASTNSEDLMAGIAADLIVLLHFAFILFVVFGGFIVLRWKWIALLHIPSAAWGVLVESFGWICPLTPLELHFREAAEESLYSGDFVDRYITPIIYPEGLTREMQVALAVAIVVINLCAYSWVFWIRSRNTNTER